MMRYIAVLGSTGSIGTSTLRVVRQLGNRFRVLGLTANSNIDLLYAQAKEFKPEFVCVEEPQAAFCLQKKLKTKILTGQEGLKRIISDQRLEKIVLAISGSAALKPLLTAIECRKKIALANKEALVMAGPLIMQKVRAAGAEIIPVDSEQSAIWQCLQAEESNKIKKVYLTASGGPLRGCSVQDIKRVSLKKVLEHPRWKMGKKISVDSATLMNKGLELLEAMYLFNLPAKEIEILIHPEAVIHSMVEFVDGVVMAQLSFTDMRIPIQYALTYPERLANNAGRVQFTRMKSLNFEKPDFKKFPCLQLAVAVANQGGTAPCVLNAANEICVQAFLNKNLKFCSIPMIIEKVLRKHKKVSVPRLEDIFAADAWARQEAIQAIRKAN
ncbi:MAG: 1-deoxy-D-xylulose-5-phosphate reductoisomerase [Candidatus Omnitrophica bacterium]|nr:1-deoxy-D-xylulose-5-phosphate reductoisomerase [Candidatus Omnitrophota bacterium]